MLKSGGLRLLRSLLSSEPGLFLIALAVSCTLKPINTGRADGKTRLRVAVFSRERWRQDVETLGRIENLQLLDFPTRLVELINAILQPPRTRRRYAPGDYFLEADPMVLEDRDRHAARIAKVMQWVRKWRRLDCAVSGAFKYVREVPFARACNYINLPFVALHKEFTVLEPQHVAQRATEARNLGFRFFGSHLAVVSETAKKLMADAGIFPSTKISTIGLMRADSLHREAHLPQATASSGQRPQLTLFSFGTLTGPFPSPLPPLRSYYFSADESCGFTELFADVHGGFAEMAIKHPEADFLIKPKNVEDWWIREIDAIVRSATGLQIRDIPNLRIVGDSAPILMRRSLANIVLNSTTVIESRVLDRNTIIPIFAEAAGRHADMIYFRDYLDLFSIAESKQGLQKLLEQALQGHDLRRGSPERLQAFLNQQIGNPDGRAAERFSELLHRAAGKSEYRSGAAA